MTNVTINEKFLKNIISFLDIKGIECDASNIELEAWSDCDLLKLKILKIRVDNINASLFKEIHTEAGDRFQVSFLKIRGGIIAINLLTQRSYDFWKVMSNEGL